ncbi:hypothetical protein C2S52_008013 [Perilla frutescens var. hirtella]|nr:hypothetical protein C2S51_018206 [Perilla frutescens var. frutescens]KAH6783054.1 hypothetical protein C2S52_008013 [Perilla frutescens var. hirtella]
MMHCLIILCFLFTFTAAVDDPNHISINCGRAAALSGDRGGAATLRQKEKVHHLFNCVGQGKANRSRLSNSLHDCMNLLFPIFLLFSARSMSEIHPSAFQFGLLPWGFPILQQFLHRRSMSFHSTS